MAASKNRALWTELPAGAREMVEHLVRGTVVGAENCEGGFSPGLASKLTLGDGSRVFVKAIDCDEWPDQSQMYRDEAAVAAAMPAAVPTPRFLGSADDGPWFALAFECVAGTEPTSPWQRPELDRVLITVDRLAVAVTPSPISVPSAQPRIGGWAGLTVDTAARDSLAEHSPWAANNLHDLARLEQDGLVTARGRTLVHFDLLPHNILITDTEVLFVDWAHARLGAPFIDSLMVLASAAADGIDPEPILPACNALASTGQASVDAVLTALTGAWLAGGIAFMQPGLEPIGLAKLHLGLGALRWLRRRLER
jgi:hypothetical protein